jgi:outer membrane protein OmpA-like peptidoglycan-associated protein
VPKHARKKLRIAADSTGMTSKPLLIALALALPIPAAAENFANGREPQRAQITTIKSFDYGKTYVHTPEREELQRIAHLWRQRKSWTTITVEGHGYVQDDEEASIALGEKRADRVKDLLVKMGVDPRFVVAVGHSRSEPGRYAEITVETCDRCRR